VSENRKRQRWVLNVTIGKEVVYDELHNAKTICTVDIMETPAFYRENSGYVPTVSVESGSSL